LAVKEESDQNHYKEKYQLILECCTVSVLVRCRQSLGFQVDALLQEAIAKG